MRMDVTFKDMDNNSSARLIFETVEHMNWMTWQDQERVVELCREITKPMTVTAQARYKVKKGDADVV